MLLAHDHVAARRPLRLIPSTDQENRRGRKDCFAVSKPKPSMAVIGKCSRLAGVGHPFEGKKAAVASDRHQRVALFD